MPTDAQPPSSQKASSHKATEPARGERPLATVSVDMDPVDVHLAGYGHVAPRDRLVYERALARLRAVLAERAIRATFFVVARDLPGQAAAIRALCEAGHEVASHSLRHPEGFAALPADALREELRASRARLEDATGAAVCGFRAPGFELTRPVAEAVREAGYRYDASLFPSPLLRAGRWWLAIRRRSLRPRPRGAMSLRRRPFALSTPAGPLLEFPLAVTPTLRLPVYHTARYLRSEAGFTRTLDRLAGRGDPLSYVLHAVDALGLAEDAVDPRLAMHPGMRRSLGSKLALLDRSLAAVEARFRVRPFAARVGEPCPRAPQSAHATEVGPG